MYFFGFLPPINENMKKKPWKSNFLGRILNAVNTPKNVEKHVIYYFFQKKSILWQYSVCFDEKNVISLKSSKNNFFGEKKLFSW